MTCTLEVQLCRRVCVTWWPVKLCLNPHTSLGIFLALSLNPAVVLIQFPRFTQSSRFPLPPACQKAASSSDVCRCSDTEFFSPELSWDFVLNLYLCNQYKHSSSPASTIHGSLCLFLCVSFLKLLSSPKHLSAIYSFIHHTDSLWSESIYYFFLTNSLSSQSSTKNSLFAIEKRNSAGWKTAFPFIYVHKKQSDRLETKHRVSY